MSHSARQKIAAIYSFSKASSSGGSNFNVCISSILLWFYEYTTENTELLIGQTALSCPSSAQNQIKLFILEFNLQPQLPPIASIQQQQNPIQSNATNYKGQPFAFRSDTGLLLTPNVRPACLPHEIGRDSFGWGRRRVTTE